MPVELTPELTPELDPPAAARPSGGLRSGHLEGLAWLLGLTALGFAIRVVFVMWLHPVGAYLYSDMDGAYHEALAFAEPHHLFNKWDTIKPRAMGFVGGAVLRWFHGKDTGLRAWGFLQVLLSSATLPLTFLGARRFFGARAAVLTTAFLTISYLPVGFAGYLMVETYLMFFLALSFALLVPQRPLLCLLSGVALGLGCLFKPQGLPLMPLWCLLLFFWPSPGQGRRSFTAWLFAPQKLAAVLLGVGVIAAILPEVVAVSRINGKPTFLTPYGGQNFYIGHCHVKLVAMDGGRDGTFFSGIPKVYQRDEPWPDITFHVSVFDSAFFVHEGMKCVRRSIPATVLWVGEQLLDVFAGWPGSSIDPWPLPTGWSSPTRFFNVLIGDVFAPLALWTLWRRRRELSVWLGFAAPMAAVWGLAVIFSGDPRYREPFDLFIVAGGASMLLALWDRVAPWLQRALLRRLIGREARTLLFGSPE